VTGCSRVLHQRSINENTHGLLRQHFPKGMDLSTLTQTDLDAVAWQLVTRPRKSLGWKCPAKIFMPNNSSFDQYYHQTVALQT